MFFKKNLTLKIICILISVGLWAMLKYTQSPWVINNSYQASMSIPITYVNRPANLTLINAPETTAISVKGTPRNMELIKPFDFKVTVNLEHATEGRTWVDLNLKSPPGVTVTDIQPSRVNVLLEARAAKTLPVKLKFTGKVQDGYIFSNYTFNPEQATVSGLKSLVSQVSSLNVEVNIDGMKCNSRDFTPIFAVDSTGKRLDLPVTPSKVELSLKISPDVTVKRLPVLPNFVGKLPEGYTIKSISWKPKSVMVKIPEKVNFSGEYLSTTPVDLSNLNSDIELALPILRDKSLKIVEGELVNIKIQITKEGTSA